MAVVLASAVLALPAASFPGRNGDLLFEVVPAQTPREAFGGGPVHLVAMDVHGGGSRDLGVVAGDEVEFVEARYTPDGRRIVFLHAIDKPNSPEARYSLDLMNADGSRRRVLIRQPYLAQFAISPDGKSLAVLAIVGHSRWSIYLSSIAHPRLRLLSHTGPLGSIRWTKEHNLIVFNASSLCWTGTCRLDTTTGRAQTVSINDRSYQTAGPAVSPDGKTIAFYNPHGPAGVRIFGLDGRFHRTIRGFYPCVGPFAPDGSELALQDRCSGPGLGISLFDFRTRRTQRLQLNVPVPVGGEDHLVDWQPRHATS